MYYYNSKIKEVVDFNTTSGTLNYATSEGLVYLSEKLVSNSSTVASKLFDKRYLIVGNESVPENKLHDITNDNKLSINLFSPLHHYFDGRKDMFFGIDYIMDPFQKRFVIYDVEKKSITSKISDDQNSIYLDFIYPRFIFRKEPNFIGCIDIRNKESNLWGISFDNYKKFSNAFFYFGHFNKLLFLRLDETLMLTIDLENGKQCNLVNANHKHLKLDCGTGKLIHPNAEIDLVNNKQTNINIIEKLDIAFKDELIVYPATDFTFNETLLFFSATQDHYPKKGSNPVASCHLFAVDKNTKKQLWHHTLNEKEEYKAVKKMEVTSDKLYVLDHGNTLHIFERE